MFLAAAPASAGDLLTRQYEINQVLYSSTTTPRLREMSGNRVIEFDAVEFSSAQLATAAEVPPVYRYAWFSIETDVVSGDAWTINEASQKQRVKGFSSGEGTVSTPGQSQTVAGIMFRATFPTRFQYLDFGVHAGYLSPPALTSHAERITSSTDFHAQDEHSEITLLRTGYHVRLRTPPVGQFEGRLLAGGGLAFGNETFTATEVFRDPFQTGGNFSRSGRKDITTGYYEISPSIAFVGKKANVSVGWVFIWFQDQSAEGDYAGLRWSPTGLRIAAEF